MRNEIDLKELFFCFRRNKFIIFLFILISLIIGSLNTLLTRKTWQGEFQIVLNKNESQIQTLNITPNITDIIDGSNSNALETEVEILKSPSVLMNVFEYVKSQNKDSQFQNNLKFKNWRESTLNIGLEEGTSILKIAFLDNDKDLIIDVLKKISFEYQEYSGKKRLRSLELGKDYFDNQIKIFKTKSLNSIKEAQEFAIEQDLVFANSEIDKEILDSINIEALRVSSRNEISRINNKMKQLESMNNKSEEIIYIATFMITEIPELNESPLLIRLKRINTNLASASTKYQEGDKTIINLKKEKELFERLLKNEVKGLLIAKKNDAEAIFESTKRPKGILTKYNLLKNEAIRDKKILEKLEIQYQDLLLERAKSKDPWELITKPTLLPYPVAPKTKQILALSLIIGFSLGALLALINEKYKGIIYSIEEIKSLIKGDSFTELSIDEESSLRGSLRLFANGKLNIFSEKINLISVSNIDKEIEKEIIKTLENCSIQSEISFYKDFENVVHGAKLLIICEIGKTTRKEIMEINQKISLIKTSNIDFLILKRDLYLK